MARDDSQRLDDIASAVTAIDNHLSRGDLTDPLVLDAVRMRLVEIGEAVKSLSDEVKDREPTVPWRQIAGMRDRLTHRYFENEVGIIGATLTEDLPAFAQAISRLKLVQDDG